MANGHDDNNAVAAQRAAFYAHYLRYYSRHVVVALLFGAGAILSTALLDWLFQPEVAATVRAAVAMGGRG